VCNGKLSVGQVIRAWKLKRNLAKHRAKLLTVLRTRCSSGSVCLPAGLRQSPKYLCRGSLCLCLTSGDCFIWWCYWFRGAGWIPAAPRSPRQPVSLSVLGHPHRVPDWDWKGPSPSPAALWRNHYFANTFSVGFVGRDSLFGPCRRIPCSWGTSPFPCSVLGSCLRGLPMPFLEIN